MLAFVQIAVAQLRDALRHHRAARGLSHEALAESIAAVLQASGWEGKIPHFNTLRRFIESETEPHETTVYAVREYLSKQVAA